MAHTVVGVLRGGPSREHDVSLATGAAVLRHLPDEKFYTRDLYVDKFGQWHDRGRPVTPEQALRQVDVVFNGLHGEYGEDGEVQKILARYGVPFTGSDAYGSYLSMHKVLSKSKAEELGLLTPRYRLIETPENVDEVVREIVRSFSQPVVVKPLRWGSSVGVSIVGGYAHVLKAIAELFAAGSPGVLVEERIRGREATVGVVEGLRDEKYYVLPVVEILPPRDRFYDYEAKYSGITRHNCPAHFSRVATEDLQRAARLMHRALGLRHYSRSDFIVTPRGVYYLETNSLPGITGESNVPIALAAVGVSLPDFFTHLVNLALSR